MYPVSDLFLRAVRSTHQMIVKVERADTVDGPWTELTYGATAGQVTIDRNGDVRRTLDLTLNGWQTVGNVFGEVDLHNTLLKVQRGIRLPGFAGTDPVDELVPLGVFRVYDVEDTANQLHITGYSQEVDLRDRRWTTPFTFVAPGSVADRMLAIIQDAGLTNPLAYDPALPNPHFDPTGGGGGGWTSTGGFMTFDRDRLKALQDLASSVGADFHAGPNGEFVVAAAADIDSTPVWTIDSGPTGALVGYSRKRSRQSVYNGVVVSNEDLLNLDPAVDLIRLVVVDDDPDSPTYWFGPYGQVPRFYVSQYIQTRDQAISAGANILSVVMGIHASLDFQALPNPALDVDDVVEVVYKGDINQAHIIDSLNIGLGSDSALQGTTRTTNFVDPTS